MRHLIGIGFAVFTAFAAMTPDTAMAKSHGTYEVLASGCIVHVRNGWDNRDRFYYCTNNKKKTTKCSNVTNNTSTDHSERYPASAEPYNIEGKNYFCCIDEGKTDGFFVKGDKYELGKRRTRKKRITEGDYAGGYCTETVVDTVCGEDTVVIPCDTQDECADGEMLRTKTFNGEVRKECVKPCASGEAFESTESDNCVKCPITQYQGPVGVDSSDGHAKIGVKVTVAQPEISDICLICDSSTSFFNRETRSCVSKDNFIRRGNDAIKACWKCIAKGTITDESSLTHFEECLKKPDLERESYVKSNCQVK